VRSSSIPLPIPTWGGRIPGGVWTPEGATPHDASRGFLAVVFRPTTFLASATITFLVSLGLEWMAVRSRQALPSLDLLDGSTMRGEVRIPAYEVLGALAPYFLASSCALFLASTYLWVHRDRSAVGRVERRGLGPPAGSVRPRLDDDAEAPLRREPHLDPSAGTRTSLPRLDGAPRFADAGPAARAASEETA
jgi:hypothetical protein